MLVQENMKKKKWLALVLSSVVSLSLLAGCSGGSEDKNNEAKATSDGNKTELEFFSNKQESIQTLQTLIDKFNAQSKTVSIKLNAPADPDTVLKTRMAKGDMPDIVANSGARMFTELTSSGFLENMAGEEFYDKINPSYLEMMYGASAGEEGAAYGVPYAANASGVIYNKDLFEQAKVEIPKTWDELMDVCKKFEEKGITPFELTMKTSWTVYSSWNALAAGNQPDNFIQDRKEGKTSFLNTHKVVAESLSKIADNAQKDYMGTSYEDGTAAFANGDAAMLLNGNWAIPECLKTNPEMNVDMFAFPSTNNAEKTKVVSGLDVIMMMSTDCADKEGAKEFFRFMVEEENAKQYIKEQAAFSCVADVEQDDTTVAGIRQDIADGKVVETVDYSYPDGFDLGAIISEFYLNKTNGVDEIKNIEETLKKCDEQFDVLNVK